MTAIHLDDVEQTTLERGTFRHRRRALARAAGGERLGCSHMEVPPGCTAWPRHWHASNEEAIFVLSGEGVLRLGDEELTVRAGSYIALPIGPGAAHQLWNRSDAPLTYLVFSTMNDPDIGVYPDSGKIGVFAGAAPGGDRSERTLHAFLRTGDAVDYWDGED